MPSLNYNIWSPTFQDVVLDEDLLVTAGKFPLRGIDIFADGALHITDTQGNEVTRTFTGVAPCFRWVGQIAKVHAAGTTIAADDLTGLR